MSERPAASTPGFVHLHVHSAYSLLKGSIKVAQLADLAKADHQPALALTDMDNMFGALEFSEKLAGSGIQPIVGVELAVDFGDQDPNARNALTAVMPRMVLLAQRLLEVHRDKHSRIITGDRRPGRRLWVYGRKGPCLRCGTPIREGTLGPEGQERTTWWCPSCQPGPTADPTAPAE
jgi:hypothetical protein